MLSPGKRQLGKRFLSLTKIKLLYARITLTRYTTLYFIFSLVTCVILSALQGVNFADNTTAVNVLEGLVGGSGDVRGVPIFSDGQLQVCTSLPGQPGSVCTTMVRVQSGLTKRGGARGQYFDVLARDHDMDDDGDASVDDGDDIDGDDDYDTTIGLRRTSTVTKPSSSSTVPANVFVDDACEATLLWLSDVLHDAQREDIVTFIFHLWLFSLAVVTLLNESIPHLIAAILGHTLGAAWAIYRLQSTLKLMKSYHTVVVPNACRGAEILGDWWEVRERHATAILVVNIITLVILCTLSCKLFKVYAAESFSRVGASEDIHRMYKIVLFFSVGLQLAGFFSFASTAMWISKVCHHPMDNLAKHASLYLAAFIVTLVVQIPWLVFGWICVRRECRIRFAVFGAMSVFLLTLSTVMFFSTLYRYIFITWPFFATVSVTSYAILVMTSVLGVVCRMNFGKGLAHYLQVTDALEGVDFTPVSFSIGREQGDEEKYTSFKVSAPMAAYLANKSGRGVSVYSQNDGVPIVISSSPPLVSELGPAPKRSRLSKVPKRRSLASSIRSELGPWDTSNEKDEKSKPDPPPVPRITFQATIPSTPYPQDRPRNKFPLLKVPSRGTLSGDAKPNSF